MSWNNNTKSYNVESQSDRESRLINTWNDITGGDINIDNYAGTGLQAVFYTFIQALGGMEADVVALQSNISQALKDLNSKVLRPPVIIDRAYDLIKELELENKLSIFDTNFNKLSGQPSGYYLVVKDSVVDLSKLETIFKTTAVAGVKTYGSSVLNTTLSTGQPISYNYTVATLLPNVKIKLKFTRIRKIEPFITFSANVQTKLAEKYFSNFKLSSDLNPKEILEFISDLTSDVAYCEFSYSLDGGTLWIEGYYSIPFNNYVNIVANDIIIEEV